MFKVPGTRELPCQHKRLSLHLLCKGVNLKFQRRLQRQTVRNRHGQHDKHQDRNKEMQAQTGTPALVLLHINSS